jgi:hypothetical protein
MTGCIYCGSLGPMSDEHIWGDWILRGGYLGRTMNKHSFGLSIINRPGKPSASQARIRAGDPLGVKLHVVCTRCNNGWMSRIQNSAKPYLIPLFKGERVALGEKAQRTVATWAAMATMTAENLSRDPSLIAVSQLERDHLRLAETIPPDWRVWIGCYARSKWTGQWVHTTVPILDSTDANRRPRPNTQASTFIIGKLYVHAMSCEFREYPRDWHWKTTPRANRLLATIWPIRHQLVCWPIDSLSDNEARTFATAFFSFVDAIGRQHGF